jgi:hypothetical protein
MSETLKCQEIHWLLEEAIDAAEGNTVTLDKLAAMRIRDYLQANQEPEYQLRVFQEWMHNHLAAQIRRARASGNLSPKALEFLDATDHLVGGP